MDGIYGSAGSAVGYGSGSPPGTVTSAPASGSAIVDAAGTKRGAVGRYTRLAAGHGFGSGESGTGYGTVLSSHPDAAGTETKPGSGSVPGFCILIATFG